jgi:two-component system, sensor histidine kinase LadS
MIKFSLFEYVRTLILCSLMFIWIPVNAFSAPYIIDKGKENQMLPFLKIFEDKSEAISINDILKNKSVLKAIKTSDGNLGYKNTTHWIEFDLLNKDTTDTKWIIELGYSAYSEIDLYMVEGQKIVYHESGGDWRGLKSRPISFHNFVCYLPLISNKNYEVYLRVRPLVGQVIVPITIWNANDFINYASLYHLFWGLYFGMLLIVFLYHAIVYLINYRQNEYVGYLYLTIYLATYILFELTRGGCLGVRYLWTESTWWINHGFVTSFFVMMLMFISFYSIILKIHERMKILSSLLRGLGIGAILALLLIDLDVWDVSKNLAAFTFGGIAGFILILAAFKSWRLEKQFHSAGMYYMIAAMMLYSGGMVMLLHRAGIWKDGHFISMNALNLGSIIEFVMLSVGLALRIRYERKENTRLVMERESVILATKQVAVKRMTSTIHDYFGSQALYLQEKVVSLSRDYIDIVDKKRMEEVYTIIGEILDGIRLLAHYYMPRKLSEKGLRAVLEDLIWKYNDLHKLTFNAIFRGTEEGLGSHIQEELYYVVIEIFTNVLKHAQATEVGVFSYDEGNFYCLQIKDDGIGMQTNAKQGNGLANIQDRIDSINGKLQIISEPNSGTTFLIKIPFL